MGNNILELIIKASIFLMSHLPLVYDVIRILTKIHLS